MVQFPFGFGLYDIAPVKPAVCQVPSAGFFFVPMKFGTVHCWGVGVGVATGVGLAWLGPGVGVGVGVGPGVGVGVGTGVGVGAGVGVGVADGIPIAPRATLVADALMLKLGKKVEIPGVRNENCSTPSPRPGSRSRRAGRRAVTRIARDVHGDRPLAGLRLCARFLPRPGLDAGGIIGTRDRVGRALSRAIRDLDVGEEDPPEVDRREQDEDHDGENECEFDERLTDRRGSSRPTDGPSEARGHALARSRIHRMDPRRF